MEFMTPKSFSLHAVAALAALILLGGCTGMPTTDELHGLSEKLKHVVEPVSTAPSSETGEHRIFSRKAPVIEEPLEQICDTAIANPVTGDEAYVRKQLSMRGKISNITQNYIKDYTVFVDTPEGIPVTLDVSDKDVIRTLKVKMRIEATGLVRSVDARNSTSDYKDCGIALERVTITPMSL